MVSISFQLLVLFLAATSAGALFGRSTTRPDSILKIAESKYSTLSQALKLADLDFVYSCIVRCHDVTFFAPSNAAFAAWDQNLLLKLKTVPMFKEHLVQLLEYHILPDPMLSKRLQNDVSYTTVQGEKINISIDGKIIRLNDAANMTTMDEVASNGVVHGIDAVLMPKFLTTDLVGILRSNKEFSTLVAIIDSIPGLAETMNSGNYTLFAPDNDAFERFNRTQPLATLLADTSAITDIILYHVVPNVLIEKSMFAEGYLKTLQGLDIELDITRRRVILNEVAEIDSFNLLASTAILHTIDRVLIPPEPLTDMVTTLLSHSGLSTFSQALQSALLADTLRGTGPFTCFVPTDEAFMQMPNSTMQTLLANSTALASVVKYHCVAGMILKHDLHDDRLVSLQGEELVLDRLGHQGCFRINEKADIVDLDIRATNGVIHLIDHVLQVPDHATIAEYLANDKKFATLYSALDDAGLTSLLRGPGNFTLFAPDDSAFVSSFNDSAWKELRSDKASLTKLLKYHLVPDELFRSELSDTVIKGSDGTYLRIDVSGEGERARLNGNATVKDFDIECSNGVIHSISNVLSYPTNLYSTLQANGLSHLAKAIDVAGLKATLESGEYTLFAPDNRAFDFYGGWGKVKTDPKILKSILEHHLVPGKLMLANDFHEAAYKTLYGDSITIEFFDSRYYVKVSGAWVTDFNLLSSNGMIHVISKVLTPAN